MTISPLNKWVCCRKLPNPDESYRDFIHSAQNEIVASHFKKAEELLTQAQDCTIRAPYRRVNTIFLQALLKLEQNDIKNFHLRMESIQAVLKNYRAKNVTIEKLSDYKLTCFNNPEAQPLLQQYGSYQNGSVNQFTIYLENEIASQATTAVDPQIEKILNLILYLEEDHAKSSLKELQQGSNKIAAAQSYTLQALIHLEVNELIGFIASIKKAQSYGFSFELTNLIMFEFKDNQVKELNQYGTYDEDNSSFKLKPQK